MNDHEELGIYSDKPFTEKALTILDKAAWKVIHRYSIWAYIWMVLLALLVGSKLIFRSGLLFGAILFLVLFICCVLWALISVKWFAPKLNNLIVGKPVFGKMKVGLPRKIFFTMLKCASAIKYEFKPEDVEVVRQYSKVDNEVTEEILKQAYRQNVYQPSTSGGPDDFDSRWSRIWNEQVLELTTEGKTLRDALAEDNFSWRTIPLKLANTANLVVPLMQIFQLIMIFFVARYLNRENSLLAVFQVGIFLSFLISAIWFIHHSYNIAEITLIGAVDGVPEDIKAKFSQTLEPFIGRTVRATKITVDKRYLSLVRGYLTRVSLFEIVFSTSAGLILIGITLFVGLIWPGINPGDVLLWYRNFSIGIILIPLGMFVGYYLIFFLLQNMGPVLAPIAAGVLSALLPLVTDYLITGHFELTGTKNVLSATVAGLGALLATSMTSAVRGRLEEKK